MQRYNKYEEFHKVLGYDNALFIGGIGIQERKYIRNPEKDIVRTYTNTPMDGIVETEERNIFDANGHAVGKHKFKRIRHIELDINKPERRTTIIETKTKDKNGNDITLKSEIEDDGKGSKIRKDYVGEEMVAEIYMFKGPNSDKNFISVNNYKDGKRVSWGHYVKNTYENKWESDKQKFFDENGEEKELEDTNEFERKSFPDFINFTFNSKSLYTPWGKTDDWGRFDFNIDIMFSQEAFLSGSHIPAELKNVIINDNFDKIQIRPSNYLNVENVLGDNAINELKEKQQQREQNQNKNLNSKKEWD